ncbi:hypothetical protein ACKKBG_A12640 [Auxenochlorella protothecoides x Auxenochlorella symbiontica]
MQVIVPGRFIKSGTPRGRPTPPGRRMTAVPTPAVPRLKETMTEAYFNERLEGQGWPRFDAEKANAVAREAWQALQHIYGLGVLETPLLRSPNLEAACTDCRVHLKLESSQATGSFKLRGATHALASLGGAGRVVTASTGNHALATVQAARALASRPDAPALEPVIFLPNTVTPGKARRLEALGATLRYAGDDCCDTEAAARAAAAAERCPYVSPYNDLRVAGGQGTVAFELLMALPRLHAVYVPVGGGGLVSGIASVLKAVDPGIKVIGCQPSASAVMAASVEAGQLLQDVISMETLSGATAGGVEPGSLTFPVCQDLVDEWVQVSEEEIAAAMVDLASWHALRVEGAAGVAVAALLRHVPGLRGKSVAVVLSGGNVSDDLMEEAHGIARRSRGAAPAQPRI